MRRRATPKPTPEFSYPYLADVTAARMAESIIGATEKKWTRRRHEGALRDHLTWMHATWGLTFGQPPRWDGKTINGLLFDAGADGRTRYSLLVECAFWSPLDSRRRPLSPDERRAGLRWLASWLSLEPAWGDRAFETRESAYAAHREWTQMLAGRRLAGLALGGSPTPAVRGTRLPHLIAARAGRDSSLLLIELGTDAAIAEIVRLQMHVALVEGWAFADPASVGAVIEGLAELRAEFEAILSRPEAVSEAERTNAVAAAKAVDRALTWLYEEHSRATQRASDG